MSMSYPLGDMLTRIRNANHRMKGKVDVPSSMKLKHISFFCFFYHITEFLSYPPSQKIKGANPWTPSSKA